MPNVERLQGYAGRKGSVDPQGYYRLLELSGKEGTATEEEIKV